MSWLDIQDNWKWIGSVTAPLIGWLARRPLSGLWLRVNAWYRREKRIAELQLDIEELKRDLLTSNQSRDAERQGREMVTRQLQEFMQAAELIQAAKEKGLIVTLPPSSPTPAISSTSSSNSPPKPTGPLDILGR